MKLLVQSLDEDVRERFKRLPKGSISTWRELEHYAKEQYVDKANASYILNEFNNIKTLPNECIPEFNARFQKGMYKLFQVIRFDDKVYLTTYFNTFDGKMGYQLRYKEPRTLIDAFIIVVNIENNMRISSNLGNKRDGPRLFGSRGNKREDIKLAGGKKKEET